MSETIESQRSKDDIKRKRLKRPPFVGYISWLVQRITAVILLVVMPLKIYSGYVMIGKLPGSSFIGSLHINAILDSALIFAFIFHALYGFRVILVDFGIVTDNRSVFKIFTVIGAILCAVSFYYIVS